MSIPYFDESWTMPPGLTHRDFLPDASPDHPGVITLPPAYQRREPCPLCRSGGRVKVSPLGEFPLAQGDPQ